MRPPLLPAPDGPLPVPTGNHPVPALRPAALPVPAAPDPRARLREALRRAAHAEAADAYDLPPSAWRGRLTDVVV